MEFKLQLAKEVIMENGYTHINKSDNFIIFYNLASETSFMFDRRCGKFYELGGFVPLIVLFAAKILIDNIEEGK